MRTPEIECELERAIRTRPRTVHDARRLLAHMKGRLIPVSLDDGVCSGVCLYGVYENVIHDPDVGFMLVLRGLLPVASQEARRAEKHRTERTAIPVAQLTSAPSDFAFLNSPRESWDLPPVYVDCSRDSCGAGGQVGRFCVRCGTLVRKGRWVGPSYAAWQSILSRWAGEGSEDVFACSGGCGARIHRSERFCGKCAHPSPAVAE